MQTNQLLLFDFEKLQLELDADGTVCLLSLFKEDTADIIGRIHKSLNSDDLKGVKDLTHMLKGCCRTIGALSVEQVCDAIEDAARASNKEMLHMLYYRLDILYTRLRQELDVYLEDKSFQ